MLWECESSLARSYQCKRCVRMEEVPQYNGLLLLLMTTRAGSKAVHVPQACIMIQASVFLLLLAARWWLPPLLLLFPPKLT